MDSVNKEIGLNYNSSIIVRTIYGIKKFFYVWSTDNKFSAIFETVDQIKKVFPDEFKKLI